MTTDATARAEYIAGLRKLADALEADPSLPAPSDAFAGAGALGFPLQTREGMAAWARLLTDATESTRSEIHHIAGRLDGLPVRVYASTDRLGGVVKRLVTRTVEQFEVEPFLPVPS